MTFQVNSMTQRSYDHSCLNICRVDSNSPAIPNFTLTPSTALSYDVAMANVSSTLCQDVFVSDLINQVNIKQMSSEKLEDVTSTPSVLPELMIHTFTNERHHKLTP